MYVKGLFEVYKILQRLGIKPKDIIGMGGDIVKMGKSLFNTRINPKLIKFVEKNQKIPTKIIEDIKIHARTLKNASESQKNLFQANIKDLLKAKTPKMPKSPVTGVQRPATSVKEPATEAFKGWTPKVIKGGKDKLATGGRVKFEKGTTLTFDEWREQNPSREEILGGGEPDASLGDYIKPIPQYDEHGNLIPTFSKTGDQQIDDAPEGMTSDKEFINFVMSLDIPLDEKITLLGDLTYGKGRDKIEYKGHEIGLGEGGGKSRKIGIGYNEGQDPETGYYTGDGFGGHVKVNVDTGEPEAFFKWSKSFAKGGIANHFRKK